MCLQCAFLKADKVLQLLLTYVPDGQLLLPQEVK
jgi:hypothetical protein